MLNIFENIKDRFKEVFLSKEDEQDKDPTSVMTEILLHFEKNGVSPAALGEATLMAKEAGFANTEQATGVTFEGIAQRLRKRKS